MIYVITNRKLVKNEDFYSVIERAVSSKIDALVIREKDLNYDELLTLASRLKKITDEYKVPLIINGDIKVAEKIGAYGYHSGYEKFKKANIKTNLKIGISVHTSEEAKEAEKMGADYIIAGHVFETDCKNGLKGRGLDFIKKVSDNVSIPVIAIGGISPQNAKSVIESGASGVAIMSSAMGENNAEIISKIRGRFSTVGTLKAVKN